MLTDGTMSLPFVQRDKQSLFFEHLRRFCCVEPGLAALLPAALSKSTDCRLACDSRKRLGRSSRRRARALVPACSLMQHETAGRLWPPDGPRVPPVGAVTFLVRLHRSTPIMRLDLDARFWEEQMGGATDVKRRVVSSARWTTRPTISAATATRTPSRRRTIGARSPSRSALFFAAARRGRCPRGHAAVLFPGPLQTRPPLNWSPSWETRRTCSRIGPRFGVLARSSTTQLPVIAGCNSAPLPSVTCSSSRAAAVPIACSFPRDRYANILNRTIVMGDVARKS